MMKDIVPCSLGMQKHRGLMETDAVLETCLIFNFLNIYNDDNTSVCQYINAKQSIKEHVYWSLWETII